MGSTTGRRLDRPHPLSFSSIAGTDPPLHEHEPARGSFGADPISTREGRNSGQNYQVWTGPGQGGNRGQAEEGGGNHRVHGEGAAAQVPEAGQAGPERVPNKVTRQTPIIVLVVGGDSSGFSFSRYLWLGALVSHEIRAA